METAEIDYETMGTETPRWIQTFEQLEELFRERDADVRADLTGATDYRDLPSEKLLEVCQRDRHKYDAEQELELTRLIGWVRELEHQNRAHMDDRLETCLMAARSIGAMIERLQKDTQLDEFRDWVMDEVERAKQDRADDQQLRSVADR